MCEYIGPGVSVILRLPESREDLIPPGLRAYDGWVFKVSKMVPIGRDVHKSYGAKYYELEGCVSKYGVSYGIAPEWITRAPVQGYGGFKP